MKKLASKTIKIKSDSTLYKKIRIKANKEELIEENIQK